MRELHEYGGRLVDFAKRTRAGVQFSEDMDVQQATLMIQMDGKLAELAQMGEMLKGACRCEQHSG